MFARALHEAQRVATSTQSIAEGNLQLSSEFLPDSYSLIDLEEATSGEKYESLIEKLSFLILLRFALSCNERRCVSSTTTTTELLETAAVCRLMHRVSCIILPQGNQMFAESLSTVEKQTALAQTRRVATLGLSALVCLRSLIAEHDAIELEHEIFLSLLAFTSLSDPWTTKSSFESAEYLISLHRVHILREAFVTESILSSFIRPLFSAQKLKSITTAGYAAINSKVPREPHDFSAWNVTSKPWRLDTCYAITVLSWTVKNASQEVILVAFHLIIPPLLILIDSPNTPIQLKGLQTLDALLPKLSQKLLEQTGLGDVIEDAIQPILLYLPPITPLSESLSLLPAAYRAFFQLIESRFPSSTTTIKMSERIPTMQKQKLSSLTRLLRQSIVPAQSFTSRSSSSDPMIQKVVLDQIPPLVRAFGMYSVAHLHALLLLVEEVLLDSFAAATLPTVLAALRALKEIILYAWPRIGEQRRRMEIIRMLVSGWRKIRDDRKVLCDNLGEEILAEFRIVGKLFIKAAHASLDEVELKAELKPLFVADESLIEVFAV